MRSRSALRPTVRPRTADGAAPVCSASRQPMTWNDSPAHALAHSSKTPLNSHARWTHVSTFWMSSGCSALAKWLKSADWAISLQRARSQSLLHGSTMQIAVLPKLSAPRSSFRTQTEPGDFVLTGDVLLNGQERRKSS